MPASMSAGLNMGIGSRARLITSRRSASEVDSREWHLAPQDWERTMRRQEQLGAYGVITLHFTPRRIRDEPASVASAIRNALKAGRARPPLPIRAVPAAA